MTIFSIRNEFLELVPIVQLKMSADVQKNVFKPCLVSAKQKIALKTFKGLFLYVSYFK